MEQNNNYKCYNCGKQFKSDSHLLRHKSRKTPCLIREISDADRNNPNRCIYCNKIFSKKENLTRHHGICKIKNGGLQTLHDKVKYEETIRIIHEERKQDQKKFEEMMSVMKSVIDSQNIIISELRTGLFANIHTPVNHAGNGNTTFNGGINTVDNSVNTININNYNNPNIEHLKQLDVFAEIFRREMAETPIALVEKIWYDPDHPENSAIHLVNKKNGEVLVVIDGRWITENAANIIPKIRHLVYELTQNILEKNQTKLINFSNDMVPESLEFARKSERVQREDYDAIMQKMIDGRKISQLTYDKSK